MPPKKKPSSKPKENLSPKERMESLLALMPQHPLHEELSDPENAGRTWVVELVFPAGCFMARSLPEPVDMAALDAEIADSVAALQTGESTNSRHLLFLPYSGGHARRIVEALTEEIPSPKLPMAPRDLYAMDGIFRVVQ
jgi:hypothetical protein